MNLCVFVHFYVFAYFSRQIFGRQSMVTTKLQCMVSGALQRERVREVDERLMFVFLCICIFLCICMCVCVFITVSM